MNHQTVLHSSYTVFCVFQQSVQEAIFSPPLAAACLPLFVASEYSHPSERGSPSGGNLAPLSVLRCLSQCTGRSCFIVHSFIVGSADTGLFLLLLFSFYNSNVCADLTKGSLLAPFFQQHLIIHDALSCLVILAVFQTFFLLLYLLWLSEVSNLFDVIFVTCDLFSNNVFLN